MKVNKRCMAAFARSQPLVGLASKSRLFDPTLSLSSELILLNYQTGQEYPTVTTELKFCSLLWCETPTQLFLVTGHESGAISIYEMTEDGLVFQQTNASMTGDVVALDCFSSENPVLVAGSSTGEVLLWTLTNLGKEYKLDISVPGGVTAIACNQVYKKFLAIGASTGQVIIYDLKKKAQVLRLGSKDFSEVKGMAWEGSDPTVLTVMSEREFLTTFNLRLDSATKSISHSGPVLAFCGDILVSSGLVSKGKSTMCIPEASDCAISPRDPIMALACADGTTEVTVLPILRQPRGMCRASNTLWYSTGSALSHMRIPSILNLSQPDNSSTSSFYKSLIELVGNKSSPEEIGEYLLKHVDGSSRGEMAVDLSDPVTQGLLRGNYSVLRDSSANTKLKYLGAILENNPSVLSEITEFNEALAISRILGDYSILKKVNNPRILAAVLLHSGCADFSSLKGSGESGLLHGLLTGDVNEYLDNRLPQDEGYHKAMAFMGEALGEVQQLIAAKNLTEVELGSSYATEYFWYSVSNGRYEEVKDLKLSDPYVKQHVMSRSVVPADVSISSGAREGHGISRSMSQISLGSQKVSSYARPASSVESVGSVQRVQKPGLPMKLSGSSVPSSVQSVRAQVPVQSIRTQAPLQPSMQSMRTQAPIQQPNGSVQPVRPSTSPRPITSPRSTVSPRPITAPYPQHPSRPEHASRTIPQPRPSIQHPASPPGPAPLPGNPARDEILHKFGELLKVLREKADTKNSLLIRQRKMQCLNALGIYESLDKSVISDSILSVMENLVARMKVEDERLKHDVDVLVQQERECVWLRAVSELVKIVY